MALILCGAAARSRLRLVRSEDAGLQSLLARPRQRFEEGELLGAFRAVAEVLQAADHLANGEAYASLLDVVDRLALAPRPTGAPTAVGLFDAAADFASKGLFDVAASAYSAAGFAATQEGALPLARKAYVGAAGAASASGQARQHARALVSLANAELDLNGPLPAQGLCTTAVQLLKQDVARYARVDEGLAHETLGDALAQLMRYDGAARQWTLAGDCFGLAGVTRPSLKQKLAMTADVTSTILDPALLRRPRQR